MKIIDYYLVTAEQKNAGIWEPAPYLNADPIPVRSGEHIGDYVVAVGLNDPAYAGTIAHLESVGTIETLKPTVLYPEWEIGIPYDYGDVVTHGGLVYELIQPHTSQPDWAPDAAPALWLRDDSYGGVIIPEWVQPTGAHDAYSAGDQVTYNSQVWESTVDSNVWAPGVYGWVLV